MSGQTIYLVLDSTIGDCTLFASADELARDGVLDHLRTACQERSFIADVIALDDDGAVRALLDTAAEEG